MDKLELSALGKINLGLDILGKRPNGYHDVRMVMQTVYLYDKVTLEKTKEDGIEIVTNLGFLPVNEHNIAYKAARLLMEEFKLSGGLRITLEKHIPVAAGMAGGSSDAAAVLFGLNRMYALGLGGRGLRERGLLLGADVPYCLMRGTALAEGIGERLTPLPPLPRCWILIAKPAVSVSTRAVYERIDDMEICAHPDINGIIEGLRRRDLVKTADSMGNVLELVTLEKYPLLKELKREIKEKGALNALMSGSGPTVFGIFAERGRARRAAEAIWEKKLAKQAYVVNVHNIRRK